MATDYTKLILAQISQRLSTIDPKYISLMLWTSGVTLGLLLSYTCFTILRKRSDLKAQRYMLKLTFSSKAMEKSDLVLEFVSLLSKLHSLSKSSIITFELHQNKQHHISCFSITTTRADTLQSIKLELEQIKGVNIQNSEPDPLLLIQRQRPKIKPFVLRLSSSSTYGNFRPDSTLFIKALIQNMRQLENEESGAVIIAFRPSFAQNKIRARISSLNSKAMKGGKDYGIDQNIVKEVSELEIKNTSAIFSISISVVGSSGFNVDNLVSCFDLLSNQNYFVSKTTKFNLRRLRYTKAEDLFMAFNRGSYGSYLNCNELASIVQLSDFGFENPAKNTLSNTNLILENSMTSFKDI